MNPHRKKQAIRAGLLACATFALLGPVHALDAQLGYLPPNLNSAYGQDIDALYRVIMTIVGIAFVLTEGALLWCIFAYRYRPGRRSKYTHGTVQAELFWSVLPGIILVWLALHQRSAWNKAQFEAPNPDDADVVVVQAFPEQFQWNFRYPGPDAQFGTDDDIVTVNNLHIPVGAKVIVYLSAKDVLHSFFLPFFRVKQDALPGMLTRVWFSSNRTTCYNLQKNELEFLTEEEFSRTRVALGGFSFKKEKVDGYGVPIGDRDVLWPGLLKFHYELKQPRPGRKPKPVPVAYQGGVLDMSPADAEAKVTHVLHYVDIACAELCGLGHYRMKAKMTIEPRSLYDAWLKESAEFEPPEMDKYRDIWDEFHPEFNRIR